MKLDLFKDGMVLVPETPQDHAYLNDTLKLPTEAGAMIVGKRVNVSAENGDVAHILFGPAELLTSAKDVAFETPPPQAEEKLAKPSRKKPK